MVPRVTGKRDKLAMSQRDKALSAKVVSPNSKKAQSLPRTRSERKRRGNLLVNVSIGTRLTLSFIISALIAVLVTGMIGFQHGQSLNRQSDFYLNLLQGNTNLTTGEQFLQEINSVTQNTLVLASTPQASQETLHDNLTSLQNLDNLYNRTLNSFVADQLVSKHPDEKVLLDEANHSQQIQQQETLAASVLRTWRVAHSALGQFMDDVNGGHFDTAATLQQALVEPVNADALTSLRSLVNFNKRLASSVKDAVDVEASVQLITTITSSVIAFMTILFIGWLISGTLVRRLLLLRQVTQAVERGALTKRVNVVGRDEIADVSASVNAMLDAIANLVSETRSQRDALTNAADHLFSEMNVVSARDLRVHAPVSDDPIGMLADAFNFTIGRFRRFVLSTKTLSEQLNGLAHREAERAEAFSRAVQSMRPNSPSSSALLQESSSAPLEKRDRGSLLESQMPNTQLIAHVRRTREQLRRISQEGILNHTHVVGELSQQISQTLNRLSAIARDRQMLSEQVDVATMTTLYMREIHTLETIIAHMAVELQNVQKNTIEGFQDLDQGLQQLSVTLRQPKSGSLEPVSSVVIAEQDPRLQEMLRLAVSFAYEVTSLSHQLAQLAQGVQNSVVTFKFEGTNTLMDNSSVSPSSAGLSSGQHPMVGQFSPLPL
jgi:methyl-accepting chemotaxis protein